ncbi:MAG: site-specific integrase [Calothrix sp. MO_167.B42]|nr:site-specific integrase [Calothrix sp. MO_167.B42]
MEVQTSLIELFIKSANQRLQAQGIKLRINQRGNALFLRGMLPPKSAMGESTRQDLRMGIPASPEGIAKIELEAIAIAAKIKSGTFSWGAYQKNLPEILLNNEECIKTQTRNAGDWVRAFEQFYFSKRRKTDASLLTWRKDYLATFRKLNWSQSLTAAAIEQVVLSTVPDSRVRQRCCLCFKALAKFAGIEMDLSQWAGSYSPKLVKPRNIPGDELIAREINAITYPRWKWCVAMLATYGLRNHELFHLNYDDIAEGECIITVHRGKTGFRRVYPIYPEWFARFELPKVVLPRRRSDGKHSNDGLGKTVSQAFRRMELPFTAYDLRHAWAIRSLMFGLDVSLAAQMMGHSLKVHHDTYHHWISERHYQEAFERLMQREDRPLPPL